MSWHIFGCGPTGRELFSVRVAEKPNTNDLIRLLEGKVGSFTADNGDVVVVDGRDVSVLGVVHG